MNEILCHISPSVWQKLVDNFLTWVNRSVVLQNASNNTTYVIPEQRPNFRENIKKITLILKIGERLMYFQGTYWGKNRWNI